MVFKYSVLILLAAVGVFYLKVWMRPKVPADVKGFCRPRFSRVKDVFRQNLESGAERGGAFAVYHEGELVCDLWGGFADEYIEYPWQENTLSIFFSATKAVCAFCVMVLADCYRPLSPAKVKPFLENFKQNSNSNYDTSLIRRISSAGGLLTVLNIKSHHELEGLLDYEKPVSTYWPEFAQNGKESITVKMLASHQAGLAATDEHYSILLVKNNPDEIGRILAAQKPLWTPGTDHGYHGLTFGLYMDQLVRRVDAKHRGIDRFFKEEIAVPFDIDFSIGLPKEEHYRTARFMEFTEIGGLFYGFLNSYTRRMLWTMANSPVAQKALYVEDTVKGSRYVLSWPEYKQVPHGSMNGYGTARGMAKLYGILANGGTVGDRVLLSAASLPKLNEVVSVGLDKVLGINLTRGYGTMEEVGAIDGVKQVMPGAVFGHPGYGGQIGAGDTVHRAGWAYVTNYPAAGLGDDAPQYKALRQALQTCLEEE